MKPARAVMIGVVHRDPQGERRLRAALESRRPELVTLEVSPYAVDFRRTRGAALLQRLAELTPPGKSGHGEIQAIRETLSLPFEYRAAVAYAAGDGARVELADDSEVSRELLAEIEDELLTPENISALVRRNDIPLTRTVASFYRRARRLLAAEPAPPALLGFSAERLALLQVRDERMERVVRRVLADRRPRCWVHVGGVFHLLRIRGLKLLWERLADLDMERCFLDELDGDEGSVPATSLL